VRLTFARQNFSTKDFPQRDLDMAAGVFNQT